MKIHEIEQRSPEWFDLHIGRLTGSCAHKAITLPKRGGGELEARRLLRHRLASERLTGIYADTIGPFLPAAMQRGVDLEPMAFAAYEAETGQLVDRVGFCEHDTARAGCSPDGVVGNYVGLIELKCPNASTHLEYLRDPKNVPEDYVAQVRHNLWITGAEWCDFVSFDDRFPPALQFFRVRMTREQADLVDYEAKALAFLAEVESDYSAAIALSMREAVA